MKELNRKVLVIAVALMAVAMLAVPISAVYATKPTPVVGQQFLIIGLPSVWINKPLGESGNIYRTIGGLPVAFVGTINGVGVYDAHVSVKADGTINAHGVVTLTNAMVGGNIGDLTIKMETYNWRIISGTGGLVNLHGMGTVTWESGAYTLNGQIHFDPN